MINLIVMIIVSRIIFQGVIKLRKLKIYSSHKRKFSEEACSMCTGEKVLWRYYVSISIKQLKDKNKMGARLKSLRALLDLKLTRE